MKAKGNCLLCRSGMFKTVLTLTRDHASGGEYVIDGSVSSYVLL